MRFFNRVTLSTPESVELDFTLAGIGSRTLALVVDYHILALLLILFWVIWGVVSFQLGNYLEQLNIDYSGLPNWLLAIALLVSFIIFVSYFVFFETMWQGQTPGKRLAKIRVIRDDGRPVRLAQSSLRALLRPIDDLFFVGVLFIILGKREKRLGDWVAGTLVIQEERPVVKKALPLSDQASALAEKLVLQANLSQLTSDDFAVIREYLQRRSLMGNKARSQLSLKLARQVRDVITLTNLPSEMTPDLFLEAVYLAYQQQSIDP